MNSGVGIYRDAKGPGIYLALFTDPEENSCFSIYQISWIEMKKITLCKLKTSLSRNFVYSFTNIPGLCKVILTTFVANST